MEKVVQKVRKVEKGHQKSALPRTNMFEINIWFEILDSNSGGTSMLLQNKRPDVPNVSHDSRKILDQR